MCVSNAVIESTGLEEQLSDLRAWLSVNWDPDLTVAEWWERLGLSGWAAPGLPTNAYGKGMARTDAIQVQEEIVKFGALVAPAGLGALLAAPTIAACGTQAQIDVYVRDIVTGRKSWCQLFSEPQAGSDLAGVQTRAFKQDDEWIVNGQKVWTSTGQFADFGMLLARTDSAVPKHQGLSYFAFDMLQDGVEVRPLREMTGRAGFNEVFITDARVSDSALIGGENNGWATANITLANERAGIGSGGRPAASGVMAPPGTVMGTLSRRAGDLTRPSEGSGGARSESSGALSLMRDGADKLTALARMRGVNGDAGIRQDLARLYTLGELGRFNGLRAKAVRDQGGDIPGMANLAKLSMSQIVRQTRDVGLRILGPSGMIHAYEVEGVTAPNGDPLSAAVTEMALFAQGPSIYGGTDQVQRNIVGERVLGLPKEPSNDRFTPFSQLPKNA